MKGYLKPVFALAGIALLATGNVQADTEELHRVHMDGEGEGRTVIMIKKHVVTED